MGVWGSVQVRRLVIESAFCWRFAWIVYLLVISYLPVATVEGVVWQTNIKEARVFLRNERMHVVCGGPHIHESIFAEGHNARLLSLANMLSLEHFSVLVVGELIVFKFLVDLVVTVILQLAKNHSEKYWHVRVVVQGHDCSFFDKEENEAVILLILASNRYSIQVAVKAIRVVGAVHSKLLWSDSHHWADDALAVRIVRGAVEKRPRIRRSCTLHSAVFYGSDKFFHCYFLSVGSDLKRSGYSEKL